VKVDWVRPAAHPLYGTAEQAVELAPDHGIPPNPFPGEWEPWNEVRTDFSENGSIVVVEGRTGALG
jgi:hypothetical protein